MKKKEICIILLIIICAFGALIFYHFQHQTNQSYTVQIHYNDTIIKEFPLSKDITETISVDGNENTICIHDGSVSVTSANCENQICVHTSPINQPGQTIACLPHRLLIEIVPEETP